MLDQGSIELARGELVPGEQSEQSSLWGNLRRMNGDQDKDNVRPGREKLEKRQAWKPGPVAVTIL